MPLQPQRVTSSQKRAIYTIFQVYLLPQVIVEKFPHGIPKCTVSGGSSSLRIPWDYNDACDDIDYDADADPLDGSDMWVDGYAKGRAAYEDRASLEQMFWQAVEGETDVIGIIAQAAQRAVAFRLIQ